MQYIPGSNNAVEDTLSRLRTMDEMLMQNETNDVLKRYARTLDINSECPVDAGVLAAAQRNKFSVRTSELKRTVPEEKDYLRTKYDYTK